MLGAVVFAVVGVVAVVSVSFVTVVLVGSHAAAADAALADEPTIAQATAALRAADWPDRLSAVYALQRAGRAAAPAAPELIALLGDDNGLVRIEAAESLKRIGSPAVPLLASGLASRDPVVQLACAQTLGRIGLAASEALPALRVVEAQSADAELRGAAQLAVSLIAPQGLGGWLRKGFFEVRDEPAGPLWLLGAFGALSLLPVAWRALRARPHVGVAEEGRLAPIAADAAEEGDEPEEADGTEAEGDADEECDADEDDAETDVPGSAGGAVGRSERAGEGPLRGTPHAIAGLVAIGVGGLVVALFGRNADPDERHATFLFASVWMLFGLGFVRFGVVAALADRGARRRASAPEAWLRDRDWRRDGAGPIGAERVLPNLVPAVVLIAYLTPFHTVWRLPWSWWGAWIALGVLDLLALATLVAVAGRLWSALRAGRCYLRWSSAPVAPGARFRGQVTSHRTIAATGPATATLRCMRDGPGGTRGGDDPSADADEIYREARSFPVHARPEGGTWFDVEFEIPSDARGTNSLAARPVRWVLAIAIPTAGPDFTTAFPVPVYGGRSRRG